MERNGQREEGELDSIQVFRTLSICSKANTYNGWRVSGRVYLLIAFIWWINIVVYRALFLSFCISCNLEARIRQQERSRMLFPGQDFYQRLKTTS